MKENVYHICCDEFKKNAFVKIYSSTLKNNTYNEILHLILRNFYFQHEIGSKETLISQLFK